METFFDPIENRSETVKSQPRMVQAHRQAPWRIQTQRGALLLIVAILGAAVLMMVVNVNVQGAAAGLELQRLEQEQEQLQRQIAGLRTEIAQQTAKAGMEQRALKLGFVPLQPEDITYVIVEGYAGRQPVIYAPPPSAKVQQPLIKPIYTQSLWEWLLQGVLEMSAQPVGASP
jgi:cell division protein FtsB